MSDQFDGTNKGPGGGQHPLSPRPVLTPGETVPGLSSWVLERKLGGGGFGEVWLAEHVLTKKQRAVKFCFDPDAKTRLVTHEKNVVARVMKYAGDHPNIVPLLEFNLDGNIPWLMYEFVEGGTLDDHIKQWRDLEMPKRLGMAVRTLHGLASALACCHRLDPPLVHRDMKPQNVLVAGSVPRITDFGIGGSVVRPRNDPATRGHTAHAARLPTDMHLYRSGGYAPPERDFGSPPHPHDDVYALGVIAYQMLTGQLTLTPGADATDELRKLKVPSVLTTLIVNSVANNPDSRPKDAGEWESNLAALLQKSQKSSRLTNASVTGLKPVFLPDPVSADRSEGQPPRFSAKDFEVPTPEGTAGLPVRSGPPPLPTPLSLEPEPLPEPADEPVAAELEPEEPKAQPAAKLVHPPTREEPVREPPASGKRRVVALVLGSVLILGLAVAVVMARFPSGKRSEPSSPSEQVQNPKNDPKGDGEPNQKSGGTNGGSPEPKGKPPEVKGGTLGPKEEPNPKVVSQPKPGEARDIEIAPGVKMKFCWIPASEGEVQLGSPKEEQDYVTKTFFDGKRPDWMDGETESARGKFKTDGFWMGKYTVTQAEWKAVMGENPSWFKIDGEGKAQLINDKITDTSRFPVERVSWDMICGKDGTGGFLAKANAHGGIEKAFGKPGKFRLPTEAQWEYACRGGRGNKQPFFWGKELNGTQANCAGTSPYGTEVVGTDLGRPCAVDATDDTMGHKYEVHPWGLMHVHGNVCEWCEDYYDKTNASRVLRGGSWGTFARYCRTAYRFYHTPDRVGNILGFRLVVPGLP